MHETGRLKKHYQSQLNLMLGHCRVGFGCCEKLSEINRTTARRLLAQVDESLSRGDVGGFVATSGKIAAAHWTASLSCGLEFQRQLLASLVPE
jgi:hypothetical protein